MKPYSKKLAVYTTLAWVLTILALAFRLLARLFSYDESIGYFENGAIFPTLYYICLGLITLLAVSALFVFRGARFSGPTLTGMKETCIAEKIASVIGSLIMLAVTVETVLFYWVRAQIIPEAFTVFGLITAILAIFFFLFFCFPSRRGKVLHLLCGFAFILHLLYILGASYFELYTPMNSPVKLLVQLTAIAAVLFLLVDLRFHMDTAQPARFLFASILVIGFASVSVFSDIFFSASTEEYTLLYHLYNAVYLTILVYATVRVARFLALCSQDDDTSKDDDQNLGNADEPDENTEKPAVIHAESPADTDENTDRQDMEA